MSELQGDGNLLLDEPRDAVVLLDFQRQPKAAAAASWDLFSPAPIRKGPHQTRKARCLEAACDGQSQSASPGVAARRKASNVLSVRVGGRATGCYFRVRRPPGTMAQIAFMLPSLGDLKADDSPSAK